MNSSASLGDGRYKECPKCGYVRRPDDYAPEWQCPKCQIVYAKYEESIIGPNVQGIPSSSASYGVKGSVKHKKTLTAKILATLIFVIGGLIVVLNFESISKYFMTADQNTEVILYFSNECGDPCDRAADFLKRYEIEYIEYNISSSEEGLREFKDFGVNILPVISMGDSHVAGYDEQRLLTLLNPLITDFDEISPDSSMRVVLFSRKGCGYCEATRKYFSKYKIEYFEYDIDISSEGLRKYNALSGWGVPLILVGDFRINGFNEKALRLALRKEGLL